MKAMLILFLFVLISAACGRGKSSEGAPSESPQQTRNEATADKLTQSEEQKKSEASKRLSKTWQAATYKGLTVGQSTREDMLRILGEPIRSFVWESYLYLDENHPEAWVNYSFGGIGELSGQFSIDIENRTGKIMEMTLYPDKLSKEEAIHYFGDDYIITTYAFCPDDKEGYFSESRPIYEAKEGNAIVEYRSRGIAFWDEDDVREISYVGKDGFGLRSKKECWKELAATKERIRRIKKSQKK